MSSQISCSQLELHLKKNLAPLYIVQGEEYFLKQEARYFIRKAAKNQGYINSVRFVGNQTPDWQQLHQLLYTHSLLAEKNFIEIDFRETTPDAAATKLLEEYAQNLATENKNSAMDNSILFIDVGKRNEKIIKSSWYQTLEKQAILINLWPITHDRLPQWIIERAKKYKLHLSLEIAQVLANYSEGNLIAAAQTLEKIYLLKIKHPLTLEIVQEILRNESHFTVFQFAEFFIKGDKKALHILRSLQKENMEPTLILWAIVRELRLAISFATEFERAGNKNSFQALCKKHRVFAHHQECLQESLRRYTQQDYYSVFMKAAEIDRLIKGAQSGDVWNSLELLCLRMI